MDTAHHSVIEAVNVQVLINGEADERTINLVDDSGIIKSAN